LCRGGAADKELVLLAEIFSHCFLKGWGCCWIASYQQTDAHRAKAIKAIKAIRRADSSV
jgi:hypothetical protein